MLAQAPFLKPETLVLESQHKYELNTSFSEEVFFSNASAIHVHFDPRCETALSVSRTPAPFLYFHAVVVPPVLVFPAACGPRLGVSPEVVLMMLWSFRASALVPWICEHAVKLCHPVKSVLVAVLVCGRGFFPFIPISLHGVMSSQVPFCDLLCGLLPKHHHSPILWPKQGVRGLCGSWEPILVRRNLSVCSDRNCD